LVGVGVGDGVLVFDGVIVGSGGVGDASDTPIIPNSKNKAMLKMGSCRFM
jgi:hypothetical protein